MAFFLKLKPKRMMRTRALTGIRAACRGWFVRGREYVDLDRLPPLDDGGWPRRFSVAASVIGSRGPGGDLRRQTIRSSNEFQKYRKKDYSNKKKSRNTPLITWFGRLVKRTSGQFVLNNLLFHESS